MGQIYPFLAGKCLEAKTVPLRILGKTGIWLLQYLEFVKKCASLIYENALDFLCCSKAKWNFLHLLEARKKGMKRFFFCTIKSLKS